MVDINLIPTDDLIDELAARFDAFIMMGLRSKYKGDNSRTINRLTGEHATLLGLCRILTLNVEDDYFDSLED